MHIRHTGKNISKSKDLMLPIGHAGVAEKRLCLAGRSCFSRPGLNADGGDEPDRCTSDNAAGGAKASIGKYLKRKAGALARVLHEMDGPTARCHVGGGSAADRACQCPA